MSGRFGPQQQTTARLRSLKPFSRVIMLHVKSVEGYIFLARLRPTDQFGSRGNCQWTQSNHRRSQSLHENLMNPTKRSQSTWSSSTKHQTVTSLVELNLQVAVKRCSVSLGPVRVGSSCPSIFSFFNYSYKITRWEFIHLSQPWISATKSIYTA